MKSTWRRVNPGQYQSRINPDVQVATYCDCSYSTCMMKWAVSVDDEIVEHTFSFTRAEATAEANKLITQLQEATK